MCTHRYILGIIDLGSADSDSTSAAEAFTRTEEELQKLLTAHLKIKSVV